MNRQELTEWQQSFEKQNPLYATDLLPNLSILLFRKSLNGIRNVGTFDTPEDLLVYLTDKPHC